MASYFAGRKNMPHPALQFVSEITEKLLKHVYRGRVSFSWSCKFADGVSIVMDLLFNLC